MYSTVQYLIWHLLDQESWYCTVLYLYDAGECSKCASSYFDQFVQTKTVPLYFHLEWHNWTHLFEGYVHKQNIVIPLNCSHFLTSSFLWLKNTLTSPFPFRTFRSWNRRYWKYLFAHSSSARWVAESIKTQSIHAVSYCPTVILQPVHVQDDTVQDTSNSIFVKHENEENYLEGPL